MLDEYDFFKNKYICSKIRLEMEKRNIPLGELAKKLGKSQPYISQYLNGTRRGKDIFYVEMMKIINLTDKEIKDIFLGADLEVLNRKYDGEIGEMQFNTYLKEIKGLSDEEIKKVNDYLDFIKYNK